MMKKSIKVVTAILIVLMIMLNHTAVLAVELEKPSGNPPGQNEEAPPDKPDGEMENSGPGGSNSSNITHTGATEISSDTENSKSSYSSADGSQNSLLVTGGTSTINNPSITKTGDSDGDNSDFYGTNAAVLVKEGTLNINGGTVTTNGSHANGVFAYSNGIINITDTVIKTTSNNSGAIMVTGGGTLIANNVTAETDGNSSAPIRSDRGGGTLTVNGGTFTSHGTGSPAIYSTADITVNNSKLISTASEGIVVEGKNSVTLNNVDMEATNTKLNSNSETYKAIFIYQSMSGDADVGTSSFTAKDSKIVNNKGEIIYVTNTSTVIELENNEIINNDQDGAFLKIGAAKWGTEGKNGGEVVLNATNQKIEGDIYVDNISTLDLSLKSISSYIGTINADNTANKLSVTLDSTSTLTLTGDSYITELNNEVSDNSNINLNGYNLYVNGTKISSTNYKGAETVTVENTKTENSTLKTNPILPIAICFAIVVVVIVVKIIVKKSSKNDK